MKVVGSERRPDWPKLGPSIIIATALIVAIRTAKWVAKSSADAENQEGADKMNRRLLFDLCCAFESATPDRSSNIIENNLSPRVLQVGKVCIANIPTSVQHVFRQLALEIQKLIKFPVKC